MIKASRQNSIDGLVSEQANNDSTFAPRPAIPTPLVGASKPYVRVHPRLPGLAVACARCEPPLARRPRQSRPPTRLWIVTARSPSVSGCVCVP